MANTTLTADVIAKEALAILDNELGWLKKLHRAHESEYSETVNGYKKGSTISIRRPADFTVRSGATMDLQDSIEGKTTLVVDQQIGVDFNFTSTDLTLSMNDISERVVRPAMTNIINHMANDVATQMYRGAYNWVGTAGQTVDAFTDFLKSVERLDEMAVPMNERCAILSPADYTGFLGALPASFYPKSNDGFLRSGYLGKIAGVETYMSQVTPTHTRGTAVTNTLDISGASQSVSYDTAKNTWTQSLSVDQQTNKTLKAGDVFTIADVYMVNPKTKAATDILQQFVVTADQTLETSGTSTITISPPIIISGPHQTVDAAPATNAAVTLKGALSTSYKQNMVFHKNSMSLAVVPMELPQGANNASRQSANGFSVRVVPVYDGINDVSKWRLDLLYGRKLIDPRLITRLSGT